MMLDHMTSRASADHGHQFAETIGALLDVVGKALKRLNEIEFDAPWKRESERGGGVC